LAADGRQALEEIAAAQPRLILLDLMMPRMDGFELLAALERDGVGAIPVVVITAKELTGAERQRLGAAVERVYHKGDFDREELMEQVRRLVVRQLGSTQGEREEADA
jgi:CheY-like chemotaxis protein